MVKGAIYDFAHLQYYWKLLCVLAEKERLYLRTRVQSFLCLCKKTEVDETASISLSMVVFFQKTIFSA